MENKVFKEYYAKLSGEAWLKSLLWALVVGLSALLISAFIFWLANDSLWWVALVIFGAVTAAVTPVFYFAKFKPSRKDLARRIDDLGLEERILTMQELEGDDSLIARLQREDAVKTLAKFKASLIKFVVPASLVVILGIASAVSLGMTTVTALSAYGVIGGASEVIGSSQQKPKYAVVYEIQGSGTFQGEAIQEVKQGESATPVTVIPDEGWVFVEWSDGYKKPTRNGLETNVQSDKTIVAILTEIDPGLDKDPDASGDEADDVDELPEEPSEQTDQNAPSQPGEGPPMDAAGGQYESANQVIDGETFYGGQVFDAAFEDMSEEVSQDSEITEEEKDVIGGYFDTIKK